MENLRRFCIAISLTIMFAATALADCPIPGEVNTPPCTPAQQMIEDSANPTSISSEVEILAFDTVISVLEDLLTVY